ncbi:MAG TPA: CDP-alcohol phosphatidyltransferase family protein [Bacteroidetes bacterium]|nr:CDP-alcohol phosphatidyltransferase family protein [Bacteroidota bacterium]
MNAALIIQANHPSAYTKVYGLRVLERTCCALERAGVDSVILPATVQGRQGFKPFRPSGPSEEDFNKIKNGLLVLEVPLVLDPALPRRLIEKGTEERGSIVVADNGLLAFFPKSFLQKVKSGPRSVEEWVALAAQSGCRVETIDSTGLVCQTVFDKKQKKAAKKALIRSLTKPTDGWVSRHLNRPVSTLFSRVLAYTPITPNQFTIFTGAISLATGFFLALGGYWNYLIGGALFHFTSILDGVDGELARLKFQSSPFGQWLDTLVDNLSYLAALGGFLFSLYRIGASDAVKVAGILAAVFAVLALLSLYLYLLRFKSGGTLLGVEYDFEKGDQFFDKLMRVAAAFGKRDLFALIFFGLAIIGQLPLALGYVAIMAFFVFVFSLQAHSSAAKKRRSAV